MLGYQGKRVVVTGVASGIGEATARLLGEQGATVIGLDINRPRVMVAEAVAVDLRDKRSVHAAAGAIGGPVDGIFNCAGLPQTAPGIDVMLAGFVGPRELTESLLPVMPAGSAVVSVSSTAAYRWQQQGALLEEFVATEGFDEAAAWAAAHVGADADNYALTKAAVIAYTARRAVEVAPSGVRVNCVAPGPTDTPMTAQFARDVPGHMDRIPLPMGRMGTATEQAWALAFLGSERASFITGATLYVDGGLVAGLSTGLLRR